jgi:hypothetical protein
MIGACDGCGNALHECECEGERMAARAPAPAAKPRRSMQGRWNGHKAGCSACRSGTMCGEGRRLYYSMLRAAAKGRKP